MTLKMRSDDAVTSSVSEWRKIPNGMSSSCRALLRSYFSMQTEQNKNERRKFSIMADITANVKDYF